MAISWPSTPGARAAAVPQVHWFSPLPPAKTGIADYTVDLLPYLQRRCHVVLWTDQASWDRSIEKDAEVRRFSSKHFQTAALGPDAIPVYHIGNNSLHQGIWEVSREVAGITVLHDTRLQHLFAHVFRDQYQDKQRYVSVMGRYYGHEAREAAALFWEGACSTEYMAMRFPLVSLAVEDSLCAVVHSEESLELLDAEGYIPGMYLPFPYMARPEVPVRDPAPPFRIVLCGYFGPNRRLDSFLIALGQFEQKEKFRVEVYGPVWDPAYIQSIIDKQKLDTVVALKGFTKFRDLDRALQGAHLGVNLRYPTMGEASMSQLQLWEHGIPTMVTPVGWYGRVPEGTVLFVRPEPENEIADIQAHLRAFLNNPTAFFGIGDYARETLLRLHDPARYVDNFLPIFSQMPELRLHRTGVQLGRRIGNELGSWLPAHVLPDILPKVSAEIFTLTGIGQRAVTRIRSTRHRG